MGCHLNMGVLRLKKKGGRAEILGPHRVMTNDVVDLIAFVSTSLASLHHSLWANILHWAQSKPTSYLDGRPKDTWVWMSPNSFSKHFYSKSHFSYSKTKQTSSVVIWTQWYKSRDFSPSENLGRAVKHLFEFSWSLPRNQCFEIMLLYILVRL